MNSVLLLVLGMFFLLSMSYFISIWVFNMREEQMTNNIIKYLETEESKRRIEG